MSTRLEAFLARLYVDAEARADFLADPTTAAHRSGLDPREIAALEKLDRLGLQLTATSLARKRRAKKEAVANSQGTDAPPVSDSRLRPEDPY